MIHLVQKSKIYDYLLKTHPTAPIKIVFQAKNCQSPPANPLCIGELRAIEEIWISKSYFEMSNPLVAGVLSGSKRETRQERQ